MATLTLTAGTRGAMPNKALRIYLKSLHPGQSGIFKGKLTGAMPPLRPKHVWSIRTKLQIDGHARDLAMFNLAIDSKLRGCDVVAIKVEDIAASGYAADRATVRQKKTGRPVRFELSEQNRQAVDDLFESRQQKTWRVLIHRSSWCRTQHDNAPICAPRF